MRGSRMGAFEASRKVLEKEVRPHSGSVVDSIVIEGNTHTRPRTILREMATKEGDRLDEQVIYRDHSYLRGLGYFSDVDIAVEETAPGRVIVRVKVIDRPDLFMKYPYPVVNYDFDRGVSYGFRWKVKNFQGTGQELFAGFEKRRDREHGSSVSWNFPWIGDYRLRLNVHGFEWRRLDEPVRDDFIKERYGGGFSFGLPLTRNLIRQVWISPAISLESRESRLCPGSVPNTGGDYYRQTYLSTGLTLTYDSRDNLISPFSGTFAGASMRRFTSVDGLEQQYSFMSLGAHFYLPVGSLGSLIIAADAHNRDGDVPFFYRIGIGGDSDLRGFDGEGMRGTSRVIGTLQLRRRIFGPNLYDIPWVGKFDLSVNAVAFVDNGALMDSFDEFADSRILTTSGFGLEFMSPIHDMMRMELAFSEGGSPVLYIATGNRF